MEKSEPVWTTCVPKNLATLEESLQDMDKNIITQWS
jgi:hypothetical protein